MEAEERLEMEAEDKLAAAVEKARVAAAAAVPAAVPASAVPAAVPAAAGGGAVGGPSAAESALGSTMRGTTNRVTNPTDDGTAAAVPAAAVPAAVPVAAVPAATQEAIGAYNEQRGSEVITHNRVTKTSFTHIYATQDKNGKTLFYARYNMINKEGERVIGQDVRVGKYGLEDVGKDKFDQAEERMQRHNMLPGPWVSTGEGSKFIGGACDDDDDMTHVVKHDGMMHVDKHYHCMDGGVYNLLLARFPEFAQQLKTRLTDDEFKRMVSSCWSQLGFGSTVA